MSSSIPPNQPQSNNQPTPKLTPEAQAGANLIRALKKDQENWLMRLEILAHQAKNLKAKYDAAIAEGFNETQALMLCCQTWPF